MNGINPKYFKRLLTLVTVLLLVLHTFVPVSVQAQEPRHFFRHLGVDEGLSQATVQAICQDRLGFMWFGTKDGLNRYDGHALKIFRHEPTDSTSLGNNLINALYEDRRGQLWVGTDEGLYRYDARRENFHRFNGTTSGHQTPHEAVVAIQEDSDGNLWLAVRKQGVFRVASATQQLTLFQADAAHPSSAGLQFPSSICSDAHGVVWVGVFGGGVLRFNPGTQSFRDYPYAQGEGRRELTLRLTGLGNDLYIGTKNSGLKKLDKATGQVTDVMLRDEKGQSLFIRDIARYSEHELWLGTETGLCIYDPVSQQLQHLVQDASDPYSLSDNAIYSIYKDREGGMWVGTYFGGLNYYPRQSTAFSKYYPTNNPNTISGRRVRRFCEDASGNLWVGTEDAGLNYFNPRTQQFKHIQTGTKTQGLSYYNIHGLLLDSEQLWVGTYSHGIDVMNLRTGQLRHYESNGLPNALGDNDIYSIYKDSSGQIWVGTVSGLFRYNRQTDNFTYQRAIGPRFIYDMLEYRGALYLATRGDGLLRYRPTSQQVQQFQYVAANPRSLPHNNVIALLQDYRQQLWVGTEGGGLGRLDSAGGFVRYTTREGLPSNTVYQLLEDQQHHLWLSTMNGLARLAPTSGEVTVFTKADGLVTNQFNYSSGIKTADGTLYFGSLNGFVSFNPATFRPTAPLPAVTLTGFQLFNQEVGIGQPHSPLTQSITYTKSLTLPYNQASPSFTFAALGFTAPESIQYAYQLVGFDHGWTYLKQNQQVTYPRLPPGDYVFQVKAAAGSDRWNQPGVNLALHVRPPLWQSPLAYGLYAVLLLGAGYYGFHSYKSRVRSQHQRSLEQLENERAKDVYSAKIEFFTHVAHEIRTPLTLIQGPLEQLLQHETLAEDAQESLLVMNRNTSRLLELTNQLLDFRKIDRDGRQLSFVTMNVHFVLQELAYRFDASVQQLGLSFTLRLPDEPLYADIDHEAFDKIISNLLANAVKYAAHQITLEMKLVAPDNTTFLVRVSNDGVPIAAFQREKIFEPFFQVVQPNQAPQQKGTGLGLPLARSLAELHAGQLYLETYEEAPAASTALTVFTALFPVHQAITFAMGDVQHETRHRQSAALPEPLAANSAPAVTQGPTVLVVEDDAELQDYLVKQLAQHYRVRKASHGLEALALLENEAVDVVVSDIMMPLMDGFRLCETLKSQVEFSHLPVVLLTAKNTVEARMEGLELGADAYVEKPFSMRHLVLQIANLLTNRQRIRQVFALSPTLPPQSMATTKADEQFLTKVNELILLNLAEADFGVDQLADAMCMSKSTLFRKIKGVSGLAPNGFLQLVRLKKAAQLLGEGELQIKEIAALVGFNSSSYFTKCFQSQFGVLPKDWAGQPSRQ